MKLLLKIIAIVSMALMASLTLASTIPATSGYGENMPYATLNDLTATPNVSLSELAEVAAPENTAIDAGVIKAGLANDLGAYSEAIQDAATRALATLNDSLINASSIVNGYLAKRYTLPLLEVPPVLKVYTIDMALFRLFGGDEESMRWRQNEAALAFLKDVALGKVDLGIADNSNRTGTGEVLISATGRQFTEASLKDY